MVLVGAEEVERAHRTDVQPVIDGRSRNVEFFVPHVTEELEKEPKDDRWDPASF